MPGEEVTVERLDAERWRVRVAGRTEHVVTAREEALWRAAAAPGETAEETLRRTFAFLLEREPAEAILRAFALEDVARYFPEFWSVMARSQ